VQSRCSTAQKCTCARAAWGQQVRQGRTVRVLPSPSATIVPSFLSVPADDGSKMPDAVVFSGAPSLTSSRSPDGLTDLYCTQREHQ
jgi:hypothetical protein